MALRATLPTQSAAGLSLDDRRFLQAGLFARDAAGNPRTGVLPAHTGSLVTGTANWQYSVGAFVAVGQRQSPGAEIIGNDGAALTPAVANVTANRRLDVIYARARFSLYGDGSGVVTAEVNVASGAQSSSATLPRPTLPPGAIELATAEVPASATSTSHSSVIITPTHAFTALEGGMVLLRNAAEMAAWAPHEGALAYRLDTQAAYEYLGATIGWVHAFGKPEVGAFTGVGIYSAGGFPHRVLRSNGRIAPEGNIVSSSATFTAGDTYTFGNIPAEFAPKTALILMGIVNVDGLAELTYQTNGLVTGKFNKSFTGTLNLWPNPAGWPDKRLV